MRALTAAIQVLLLSAAMACGGSENSSSRPVVRVGHFPNITHAQALAAHALTRGGEGWFEKRLGPGVEIQWFVYNAGPSAMEAILAGSLDLSYVGPNPALNAYIKSGGEEIRVIAGAAMGGAALVVPGDSSIWTPEDFRGKRIATPQLGNTQDVACRSWLASHGFRITQVGGDVLVVPTSNADQLQLFQSRGVDGVWTVEPWVSRLELEAGGRIFLEETDALTAVLAARVGFLRDRDELARGFAAAHAELTEWIIAHPEEARALVGGELRAETSRAVPVELLERSWRRLTFTSEISVEPFEKFADAARSAGFLQGPIDLARLVSAP